MATKEYILRPIKSQLEELMGWNAGEAHQTEFVARMLNGSQAKTAFALKINAERMIKEDSLESCVMMTLTVGDWVFEKGERKFKKIYDAAEASRRINNLNRRVLDDFFERGIIVSERHKDGGIHFHILGTLAGRPDVRTGFDHARVAKGDYRSVSARLRRIWHRLLEVLPEYGFGRTETAPIRRTGEAVACYVSKYIEKNVCNRLKEDKGKKLVRYFGWGKSQLKPNNFAWGSERATAWRMKTRQLAGMIGIETPEEAYECLGPRWAWQIMQIWGRGVSLRDTLPWIEASWIEKKIMARELSRVNARWCENKEWRSNNSNRFGAELWDEPDWYRWFEKEETFQTGGQIVFNHN